MTIAHQSLGFTLGIKAYREKYRGRKSKSWPEYTPGYDEKRVINTYRLFRHLSMRTTYLQVFVERVTMQRRREVVVSSATNFHLLLITASRFLTGNCSCDSTSKCWIKETTHFLYSYRLRQFLYTPIQHACMMFDGVNLHVKSASINLQRQKIEKSK